MHTEARQLLNQLQAPLALASGAVLTTGRRYDDTEFVSVVCGTTTTESNRLSIFETCGKTVTRRGCFLATRPSPKTAAGRSLLA